MDDEQDANWKYAPAEQTQNYNGAELGAATNSSSTSIEPVSWTASEYISHEKSPSWFAGLFGATIVVVLLVYLITRDAVAAIVVFIACGLLASYANRKPETKEYQVSETGIKVGDKSYFYSEFRSFSIVEEGAISSVWLKPLKRFTPVVIMYLSPADEEKIMNVLSNFLPHEQRELDAIDRFSKRARF